ncbi:glycoside hydrolase family 3 protein [Suillus subalutaceus]|uniref:glycoside hydrolase family 3 protein n=1 Tax=Suillus subalutaceus TaxID=48586 RepID=UPI001B85C63C|nr:glycoside hydrolase family 3 protein [Suillus subalutaceus]KAG1853149.1 glycoside hydrolase family 3 protein [Suillus subalutaceus]
MAPRSLSFVLLLVSYAVASNSSATVSASASAFSSSTPVTSSTSSTSSASTSTSGVSASVSTTSSMTSYLATETEPPVFPATDPLYPPPVSADPVIVPDFAPAWAAAYTKATSMISNFTIAQKVNITTGVGWANGLCVGNTPPVGNFPGLCLQDSPLGVRDTDLVTSFPAGITTASTWNRALMRARGLAIGQENRMKGVNVALGPMMNMGRIAQGGRNWEGFGADPFLSGETAYETILGLQAGGVQATAKHYINNEQEWKRTQESSNVDDRTEHEIYAQPFMRAVMAGVSSVMCSYNLINDTYACNNNKTLTDMMKREFGFQGFIQSDWSATMNILSAVAGLDMTMPGDITFDSGTSYFGQNLTDLVMNGTVSMQRLDDMATRIIGAWYYLHQDEDYPNATEVNAQSDHYLIVREIGAAGTVLLKNEGALPLDKPKSIVLVGSDAAPPVSGPNEYTDQGGDPSGILAMGWGSGTDNFTYLISPYEAIQARARVDQTSVFWNFDDWDLASAGNSVIGMETAIVFVNSDSGEGYITVDGNAGDRQNLSAWHQGDQLILAVAAQNNNTIVVTNSVGPLIIEPWVEHPNVTAIVWANLGGNEAGNAIADILYGAWNPSGKLPYTIAKSPTDYPAQLVTGGTAADILSINYTEGLFIDYRWFDAQNITPRYEFGFGLSYTTFEYSNLAIMAINPADSAQMDLVQNWEDGGATPIAQGSTTALWLHMPAYKVTFNVKNTGTLYGGEIPQLYIHHPLSAGEPPSVLKGFTNVEVSPGQTTSVSITLSRYDLSIWDVVRQGWAKPEGTITFSVGASSRDFRLSGTIPS